MPIRWADRYATRIAGLRSSAIRELLKISTSPDFISFAGGLPGPDLFPFERLEEACQTVLRDHGVAALQYGLTEGYPPLRELIARHASRYGVRVEPDNVLITSGAQQALDLLGRIFLDAGTLIAVERPTYLGALQAWSTYGARYAPVAVDAEGLEIAPLERALAARPAFVYVMPNYHNPTGATLALERREALVQLAAAAGVPIVEDDPYGQLIFEGDPLPPLMALDVACRRVEATADASQVLGVGSFSKVLAPGLRLGWIIAPKEVVARLALVKQGADLHTSTFAQMVAYEIARGGFLDAHVRHLRTAYRARRDAMLAAMAASFPPEVHWTQPRGGLFIWVTLPASLDATSLLEGALRAKVAFVPGLPFYPDEGDPRTLRLNFSFAPPTVIADGIARLGRVLCEAVAATRGPVAAPTSASRS
jgi:2-aminoadipate transaminase